MISARLRQRYSKHPSHRILSPFQRYLPHSTTRYQVRIYRRFSRQASYAWLGTSTYPPHRPLNFAGPPCQKSKLKRGCYTKALELIDRVEPNHLSSEHLNSQRLSERFTGQSFRTLPAISVPCFRNETKNFLNQLIVIYRFG